MNQQQWHEGIAISFVERSDEWAQWRSQGIGASDAPVVMGVSPFKTINQLWKEKVLGAKQQDNWHMARGRALEPLALDFFMSETGYLVESQKCYEHPERNWMRATMDGINEKEKVLVEIKSCRFLHEEVPVHYYPQLQHQMEVVGYDSMYYVSYDGRNGKILHVKKNEEYIADLVKKEEEFWEKIKAGAKDMSDDENWVYIKERMTAVDEQMKELKEEESFLRSQAILFADGVPASGNGLYLTLNSRKGNVEYSKVPELEGVDLETYRKEPTNYWRLALQK